MSESTHLDELIAAERAKANARIARLRKQAEAEQRKVDLRIVEILKARHGDAYSKLADEAREALEAERAERSRKAKRAVTAEAHAEHDGRHESEEHHG